MVEITQMDKRPKGLLFRKNNSSWVDSACLPSGVGKNENQLTGARGTASTAQSHFQKMMPPSTHTAYESKQQYINYIQFPPFTQGVSPGAHMYV